MPQPPIQIAVTANANPLYDEIIRQARRAEAAVKKIPLRIETKDLGGFKTLTADIDRFDKSVSRMSAVITTFGQAAAIIFGIQNAFAAMVKTSVKVEKQLNDINAIFGASNKTMKQFSDGLFDVAKQTGQSFDVAATAAQEFARQGLSVEQTLKRTRDALTLTRISGLDAANATESLTAILNTFKKEALDSTRVTNVLANVDTKFAVSAADLTEALKRAGASAADARVPFNELVAAVTSLQQSTARGGSVIGNSLKSIFTRVQRGDTIDALRSIGVEVRDSEGKTKPMLKTLEQLAVKFRGLGDATRASIKEQVAGVYQINQLSALLADLSSGYSTYSKALGVANGTQNEATDRLEVLKNVTAGSLNDTLANLTKFAAESGKIVINPIIKTGTDLFNGLFDSSDGVSEGEAFGQKLGEGVLKGIGSFLTSGGGVVIAKALFNISRLVAVGVKDQVVAATTLNRNSEKKLFLQEQIKSVLLSTNPIYQSMIKSATTEAEKRQIILNILRQQESALLSINSLSSKFASQTLKEGVTSLSGANSAPRKLFGRAAGGLLPSMIAEKQAVNSGVGGAPKSARPVAIPNFNLGGGKKETIIANSSEYIVPNYANGGSAIFNQDMVKSMGLPKGAKKIMAGGYIPNFVFGGKNARNFAEEFYSPLDNKARFTIKPPTDLFKSKLKGSSIADILGKKNKYLSDVIDFDDLFNNYPQLADLDLQKLSGKSTSRGVFIAGQGGELGKTLGLGSKIGLNPNLDRKTGESTLIHEIQHAIQNEEGSFLGDEKLYKKFQAGKLSISKYRSIPSEVESVSAQALFEKKFPGLPSAVLQSIVKGQLGRRGFSGGYIPNFNPLLASAQREAASLQELGYSKEQIFKSLKVQSSPRLKNKGNPNGLGLFNTLQGQNTIGQALNDHVGENIHKSGIPNFAPRQDYRAIRQTIQDISGGVRDPIARALPKTFNSSAITALSAQIDGMTKNAKLFNKAAPILVGRLNREIEQVDKTLAAGNLSLKAQSALNTQRKLLVSAQNKILDKSSSDLTLLRNPTINNALLAKKEKAKAAIEERNAFNEITRQKKLEEQSQLIAQKEQKKQDRQNRNTNRLLALSFLGPLATEGILSTFGSGNEKDPNTKALSGAANSISTALALGTLGPLGIAAGIGVGVGGTASSIIKSRNEFTGQELTTQELQKTVDSNQSQLQKRGEFFDLFQRFTDASGFEKTLAEEGLRKNLSSFEDKNLATKLTAASFDPSKSFDAIIEAQQNIFGQDESLRDVKENKAATREFFAQIVDGTGFFTRLNKQVEFAPQKVGKFVDLLSNNVSSKDLKGVKITDEFVSKLIQDTGLDLGKFAGNASIDSIQGLTKIDLQRRQSQGVFFDTQKEINKRTGSVRTETLEKGKNLLDRTSLIGELTRRSLFETAAAKLESPVFSEEAKTQASFGLKELDVTSKLVTSISDLGNQFGTIVNKDSGVAGSKKYDLTALLASGNVAQDPLSILKSFEDFKGLSQEEGESQRELVATAKKQLEAAKVELSLIRDLKDIQAKNAQQKAILDYFNKSGLKGKENIGKSAINKSIDVTSSELALKEVQRLSSDTPNKQQRVFEARGNLARARIAKFEEEKSRGLGPNDNIGRASAISKLTPEVKEVARSNLFSDLFGAINSIKSSNIGSSIKSSIARFEKIAQTGDVSKLPTELSRLEKNATISLRQGSVPSAQTEPVLNSFIQTLKQLTDKLNPANLDAAASTEASRLVGGDLNTITEFDKLSQVLNPTTQSLVDSTLTFKESAKELSESLKKYKLDTEKLQAEEAKNKAESDKSSKEKASRDNQLNSKQILETFNLNKNDNLNKPIGTLDFLNSEWLSAFEKTPGVPFGREYDKNFGENLVKSRESRMLDFAQNGTESFSAEFPELAKSINELKVVLSKVGISFESFVKMDSANQAKVLSIPNNFDPYASAIRRAKNKEIGAGIPANQIYTDTDKRLISPTNPMGLMVANYLDEPNGGFEGVDRKIKRGLNPKLNESGIPNFASNDLVKDFEKENNLTNLDRLRLKDSMPSSMDNLRFGLELGISRFSSGLNSMMGYLPTNASKKYFKHRQVGFDKRSEIISKFLERGEVANKEEQAKRIADFKELQARTPPSTIKEAFARYFEAQDSYNKIKPTVSPFAIATLAEEGPSMINPFGSASKAASALNIGYHGVRGYLMSGGDASKGGVASGSHVAGELIESKFGGVAGNMLGTLIENKTNNLLNPDNKDKNFLKYLSERRSKVEIPNFAMTEKERKEQEDIFRNFNARKNNPGVYNTDGSKFQTNANLGPFDKYFKPQNTEQAQIFKNLKAKQESAFKRNGATNFTNATPKATQNTASVASEMEALKSLVTEISNVAVNVKNESQRVLRLDINGASTSVKDLQEMETRILDKVVAIIDKNRKTMGERGLVLT